MAIGFNKQQLMLVVVALYVMSAAAEKVSARSSWQEYLRGLTKAVEGSTANEGGEVLNGKDPMISEEAQEYLSGLPRDMDGGIAESEAEARWLQADDGTNGTNTTNDTAPTPAPTPPTPAATTTSEMTMETTTMETTTEEAAPTPAPAPICTCPNGTPAAGDKCPKDGGVKCESCKSGFELTNETACKVKSSGGGDGKDGDGDGKTKVVEKLKVAFKLDGLNYSALMANESALQQFEDGILTAIATSLNISVESILELIFSEGSVKVGAVIKPPEGVTTTELEQTISNDPAAMTTAVVSQVQTIQTDLQAAGVVAAGATITATPPVTEVVIETLPPTQAPTPAPTPAPKPNPLDDGQVGKAPPQASQAALAALAMLAAAVHGA